MSGAGVSGALPQLLPRGHERCEPVRDVLTPSLRTGVHRLPLACGGIRSGRRTRLAGAGWLLRL